MGASAVASVDASPILELAEHVFDALSLTIESAIVRDGRCNLRLSSSGNQRRDDEVVVDLAGEESLSLTARAE